MNLHDFETIVSMETVGCYTINEVSNVIGPAPNGIWSNLQVYDVDIGDDVTMTLVGGNNFDDQQAFFLPNPEAVNGYNFLEETNSTLFGSKRYVVR